MESPLHKTYFAISLRPDAYSSQAARHFRIKFELHSELAASNFQAIAKAFPLTFDENTPHSVRGHFEGENVKLSEDFVATYDLDPAGADTLHVLTYRNPVSAQPSPGETSPVRRTSEPGFFEAEALLGYGKGAAPSASDATLEINMNVILPLVQFRISTESPASNNDIT